MLYIFAGHPRQGLSAKGLQHCFEVVENLGELEHDPNIQYKRDGVYFGEELHREWTHEVEYRISDNVLEDGITWDWFWPTFKFGNGVSTYNEYAGPEYKTVVTGTDLSLEEYITKHGSIPISNLSLTQMQLKHEGWEKWEARWVEGKVPEDYVNIQLTWIVTTHKLPDFAYERFRSIIEDGAPLKEEDIYNKLESAERGTMFVDIMPFDGKSRHTKGK